MPSALGTADGFTLCVVPVLRPFETDERSLRQVLDLDLGDHQVSLLADLRLKNLDGPSPFEGRDELEWRGGRRRCRGGSLGCRSLCEYDGASCGRQEQSADDADECLCATHHD